MYSGKNPDCFWDLGAYQVCDSSQLLSIFSSLFLLMTQALVSRILVPGMSIFVNASVRRTAPAFCEFAALVSHARQILRTVKTYGESNDVTNDANEELNASIDEACATSGL